MTGAARRHLVTVWNPSYAKDAMEEHLAVLLGWAQRVESGEAGIDDRYVWWGKVHSRNRQTPQAHRDDIRKLDDALDDEGGEETQLYLTDYRSLYVGDIVEIHEGELPDDERRHAPRYYAAEQLACDFWFKLADIRLLVADDMLGVIAELRKLVNVHYGDGSRPVSLFGGMVDLPLVVERPDGARFFGDDERDLLTGGLLWAEFDATRGPGAAGMERELRENMLGAAAWMALEPTARGCIASAETTFRGHRHDPAFDFGPVVAGWSKALEVQCNAIIRRALADAPLGDRQAKVRDGTVDVTRRTLTLGQLAHAIHEEPALSKALRVRLEHGAWFTGQLPAVLGGLAEVRNAGVHESRVDRATATQWRDQLLGVGCEGELVRLARVKPAGALSGGRQR